MGTGIAPGPGDRHSPVEDDVRLERYADVTTAEGELLVYDVEEAEVWIQADRYRPLEEWV